MKKKLLSVILAAAMVLSLAACEKKAPVSESVSSTEVSASVSESVEEPVVEEVDPDNVPEFQLLALEGKEYGVDYESLYDHVGKDITIADVTAAIDLLLNSN